MMPPGETMTFWQKLASLLARFNFFAARNEGNFVALAIMGGLALVPFAINNFAHGRALLGLLNSALVAWFLVHGVAVYRGRRLLPSWAVFIPVLAMLAYSMWVRPDVSIFWAYPAALLFHFILERRAANAFNTLLVAMTVPVAWFSVGPDMTARVAATLILTIAFANVFSYVNEVQRRREAEQERQLALERDRLLEQETSLRTEQRRLDLVVRAARAGIVDWDGRTRATWYSPRFREILGHAADADTAGWPDYFKVLLHPDDRERVTARFREYILGKGEYYEPEEYRLLRADGSHVWVQSMGVCLRDESGFVTRFIAAITDITERRAQEEALRAAVRLREEVERMSRHDLKTPLNSVIAMVRLLREGGKLGSDDEELLSSIERAGSRILSMVNLSLDLVRMEQGSYEFRPRPVDLAEVARRVAADLESQAASKGVTVRVSGAGAHGALGEEHLCYSLLANLIKNAIEASPDGAEVSVALEARGGRLLARVQNAGAVPEAVRARFFQKYATSGKSGGVGLGAYSARLLARVQQGDITMRTAEAEGTTLTVDLARAPMGDAALPAASGARRRVLIVDDDEFNRLVLRRFLPSPAFEVEEAVNGRAALDAARRDWPDAVLLDLEMPVMDGCEFAERLRALERADGRKRCTIVALSSNDEDAVIRRALAAGCDHYHVKPAPRETLLRLLTA
jgi:PAS domain S-box-containing protein